MSHAKERKEKNCLNCNAIVAGRFCQVCGQENIETKETFAHLATHFISDIFHFDGQFFSTSKYLLFKPGFLTYEYVRGRRVSYLNPIKMYIFISAIFFLFFLSFFKPDVRLNVSENRQYETKEIVESFQDTRSDLTRLLQNKNLPAAEKQRAQEKLNLVNRNLTILQNDSANKEKLYDEVQAFRITENNSASIADDNDYQTPEQYDSAQQAMPEAKRDNWFTKRFRERNIILSNNIRDQKGEAVNVFFESFFHHFPQILFVSLPLIALVLQLLFVRRKQWYYVNHLIYTVHLYCAVFVIIFIMLLVDKAGTATHMHWTSWVNGILFLYLMYYTYKAMHFFYGQARGKTVVKWILFNITAFAVILSLFTLLFVFTIFTMQ